MGNGLSQAESCEISNKNLEVREEFRFTGGLIFLLAGTRNNPCLGCLVLCTLHCESSRSSRVPNFVPKKENIV